MFEITGNDIAGLNDVDLRSLVTHLAIAESRAKGFPRSAVTSGGNQDAADGGLDVRVEYPADIGDPDFIPKRITGFQVKKPDMPPGAIGKEMRPQGVLRDVIRELALAGGAYVIVSSQGSVADKPLAERRRAMRDALHDLPEAAQLRTDFYDRDRLAIWVNEYTGVAAWVRSRVGRPLSGWSGVGDWSGRGGSTRAPYLADGKACLVDESERGSNCLSIADGIARLRAKLRKAGQCIRLIGLSGLGKTRLVEALFEEGVGDDPLDPSIALYTDFSDTIQPTARDMARELVAQTRRVILVVDNCNPATHGELARLCSQPASNVSLITVEYDVRDDEPEHTDVFRLQSASVELVAEWLNQNFPGISQPDRGKIADFSDGNFRVARAIAETLGRGETLGSLKSKDLFERIFLQRNNPDRDLLQAAQELSLLYSIDAEDGSDNGELARVAALRCVGAQFLHAALSDMRQRGLVQSRGRFRAILPQAIANPLAAGALDRLLPDRFDSFCKSLSPRMLKSVSRRLGLLHDSAAARAVVGRWLRADGPLGDLFSLDKEAGEIVRNIAPVAPELVLTRIEAKLAGPTTGTQWEPWVRLVKVIGYDEALFDRVVDILARFAPAVPDNNNLGSVRNLFSALFYVNSSGTQATPAQRRMAIMRMAASSDETLRASTAIALRALMKTGSFMAASSDDFGARSRDWGWQPQTHKDRWDWFEHAIALVIELEPHSEARVLLAREFHGLWRFPSCRDALDRFAASLAGDQPWIEGWMAARATLRIEGAKMPDDLRTRLKQFIKRLKPSDLLHRARAIVVDQNSGGWDFSDGEGEEDTAIPPWERAAQIAQEIGRALAQDSAVRTQFVSEILVAPRAQRVYECGRGIAEGARDLAELWLELARAYENAAPSKRSPTLLGGFIYEAQRRDRSFVSRTLDGVGSDAGLLHILPFLQRNAGLDTEGIDRLRRAIGAGGLAAKQFYAIADGSVADSPEEPLALLLREVALLPDGVEVAMEVLHMWLACNKRKVETPPMGQLVRLGRALLSRVNFGVRDEIRDHNVAEVVRICLHGEEGRSTAREMCRNIHERFESSLIFSLRDLVDTLRALFEVQPLVALDAFLLGSPADRSYGLSYLSAWTESAGEPRSCDCGRLGECGQGCALPAAG